MNIKKQLITTFFLLAFHFILNANNCPKLDSSPQQQLNALIMLSNSQTNIYQAIEVVSENLKGIPYGHGEGSEPTHFYIECMNCTTFVENVLAISYSQKTDHFSYELAKVRFFSDDLKFSSRNHLPYADWVRNNINNGLFQDITSDIGIPTKTIQKNVHRGNWLQWRSNAQDILDQGISSELKQAATQYNPEQVSITYLPVHSLLNNPELLDSIPSGSIFNVVIDSQKFFIKRKPYNKLTGTHIFIAHQGFIIKNNSGEIVLRHASTVGKRVKDDPILSYLQRMSQSSYRLGLQILLPTQRP